jgi:hypothetical protein
MTAAARLAAVVGALAVVLGAPAVALGHTLGSVYESRLPLEIYLAGAGITVALSFAFVLLRDVRVEPAAEDGRPFLPPAPLRYALRAVGLAGWLWILVQGVVGGRGEVDIATVLVWIYTWVGVAIVSALVFPIWHWLDPFSTLHDIGAWILRRVGFGGWDVAEYPARLGRWPAVAALVFLIWLEIVLRQGTGRPLFISVMGYTAYTVAMMAQFGRDTWRDNGEVFGVWFRILNRLAPFALADEDGRVRRRPLAGGLLERGWTHADVAMVGLGTGSILFDGLSQTAPWYDVFGAPGAPALTLQLFAFLALIVGAALLLTRVVGLGATGAGLLPIAVGYLVAHYLTYLLVDGQSIVAAVSDPLSTGENLFGTSFFEPVSAFLPPGLVWTVQLVAVVGGHMLGAWGGHVAATRDAEANGHDGQAIRIRQVPLAVVMVALTTVTLWSLGQAVVVTPQDAAALAGLIPA